MAIHNFTDKETARIWAGDISRRLPHEIQQVARRKLRMINNAHVGICSPPGNGGKNARAAKPNGFAPKHQ